VLDKEVILGEIHFTRSLVERPKQIMQEILMFLPRIEEEKCNNCGECVDVCPADVLVVEGQITVVAVPQECLGCESCVSVCPTEAITVEEI